MTSDAPQLFVESIACGAGGGPGKWRCAFTLSNRGQAGFQILEAWLPHNQFFSQRSLLHPPLSLFAGAEASLDMDVDFAEAPGAQVTNAFLILRVDQGGRPWRVFARLLPVAQSGGKPEVICESVTAQPVGFSV